MLEEEDCLLKRVVLSYEWCLAANAAVEVARSNRLERRRAGMGFNRVKKMEVILNI